MTVTARRTLPIVVALLAALLAGCGGEDDPADASPLSKAEFIEQGNKLCERERKGMEGEVARFMRIWQRADTREELNADLAHNVLLPTLESEMEALRSLRVPPAEEEEIDEILYAAQLPLDKLVFVQEIASRKAIERRFAEAARTFDEYGLDACVDSVEP